jgi:hypothetical protein
VPTSALYDEYPTAALQKSKSYCDWRSVNQLSLGVKRMGLSFVYAADPRQRSLSRVRVPWAHDHISLS